MTASGLARQVRLSLAKAGHYRSGGDQTRRQFAAAPPSRDCDLGTVTSVPVTSVVSGFSRTVICRLTARGESLAAFDERCIPASGVAPPSNTPGILSRRALPAGRLARLGATPDFHHGLLQAPRRPARRAHLRCHPPKTAALPLAASTWHPGGKA